MSEFIGSNDPRNPFGAAGRVNGKSAEQIKAQGMDANGHPLPSQPKNGQVNGNSPSRPGGARGQSLSQLVQSIGSMELSNQDDLHAFCEAYRALGHFLAVTAKMAEGQLKAAARAQAKQAKDGWMTPTQRVKLGHTLRQVGKDIDAMAQASAQMAVFGVKAWRRFEATLDELESDGGNGRFGRPGGRRGGFDLV
jgi:hypothetical protein